MILENESCWQQNVKNSILNSPNNKIDQKEVEFENDSRKMRKYKEVKLCEDQIFVENGLGKSRNKTSKLREKCEMINDRCESAQNLITLILGHEDCRLNNISPPKLPEDGLA